MRRKKFIPSATPNPHQLADERPVHELVETLLSHQKDFDWIDEITLQENVTSDGQLTTPETYQTILLPHLRFIDARTAEAMLRFTRAGGKVLAIGQMPKALTRDENEPVKKWADESIGFSQLLDITLLDTLTGPRVNGSGARDVFILRRKKENHLYSFLFNRCEQAFKGTLDGHDIAIPPRGSLTIKDTDVPATPAEVKNAIDLSANWTVTFEPNHLPLNFWHAAEKPSPWDDYAHFNQPGFNLLAREKDPIPAGEGLIQYACRFMLTGEIPDARIVLDDAAIAGDWKLFVNGVEISDWTRAVVFDCRNRQAVVGHALRGGSNPTLNIITLQTRGPNRGLFEVPYLYGSFTCEYRYSHLSFPFVKGNAGKITLDSLQPWNILGYPTFSGSAAYNYDMEISEPGDYLLDLGNVLDVASVRIDDRPPIVLAWPPYRCTFENLATGKHSLCVEVTNPPANRNRAANLPAGLLGPVRLFHIKGST